MSTVMRNRSSNAKSGGSSGGGSSSSSVSSSAARDSLSFTLPDGRMLSYAEYGSPTGAPLFYFHGYPMSRLEAYGTDHMARARGIRVIAPDRPGFGLSSFQPDRRITDWPADVTALARHLSLSRFAVMGVSGGGPYALACAHAIPRESLTAAAVLAGAGPWRAGTEGLPWYSPPLGFLANWFPWLLGGAADLIVGTTRWILSTEGAKARIDAWIAGIKKNREEWETPREELSIPERRERVIRAALDGFAQGSRGPLLEARLLASRDWGFELEDIAYAPVKIWHGTEDTNSPVRMARYMAEHIPGSVLHEMEGESHSGVFLHLEEILLEVMGDQLHGLKVDEETASNDSKLVDDTDGK
ncbi:Alpha/Beta hydrolase protein [Xylariales sp. PMI_506]|nr:Alpha/Beta hydrolase protein [Xylariales sp. PMI_506]